LKCIVVSAVVVIADVFLAFEQGWRFQNNIRLHLKTKGFYYYYRKRERERDS
jgi:hypothetical protein